MISAKIIADSLSPQGQRLTTMVITFPRYILAEFNTHRMFSRNSASSRAIRFEKMVENVKNNPFVPIAWQKDHKGMQGTKYFQQGEIRKQLLADNNYDETDCLLQLDEWWLESRDEVVKRATLLNEFGATKQMVNRLLEPFMWHTVIVTATEWENFFALRAPQYVVSEDGKDILYRSRKDLLKSIEQFPSIHESVSKRSEIQWLEGNRGQADIHMMALAEAMWDAKNDSQPRQLKEGEWHVPYGDQMDMDQLISSGVPTEDPMLIVKIATARAAAISYEVPGEDEKPMNYEKLIKLHDRLAASGHWSPFEHCAKVMGENEFFGWCRNFRGFIQYRALIDKQ